MFLGMFLGMLSGILAAEGTAEQPHGAVTFHYGVGPETVIEGVTITGAYDGAIRAYGASTYSTVRECPIKNNQGMDTACAICGGGGIRLANCVFEQDAGYAGRAPHMSDAATMEIQGCLFKNHSGDRGGAIYCRGSDPHFMDCHFESNQALDGGGAIWFQERCQAVLEQCSFTGNQAQAKGGRSSSGRRRSSLPVVSSKRTQPRMPGARSGAGTGRSR